MARVFYTVRMHFENLATIEKQADDSQQAGTNLEPASQEERRSCVMCQVAVAFLVVVLLRLARIGCYFLSLLYNDWKPGTVNLVAALSDT
jgi:hypothetical protein